MFQLKTLREVCILNLIGVVPLLLLFGYQHFTGSGLSSYLNEIETYTSSPAWLCAYLVFLVLYSVGVEYIFKQLILEKAISRLDSRWGITLGIIIIASLYLCIHSRYESLGALIYACALIIGTSIRYTKNRCWRVNALWHVQWNMGALIVGLIVLPMVGH